MKKEEKRKLRQHREKVLDDVSDPKPVLDGLISRGVLTTQSDDYQHILAGQFVRDQTRRLLDLLPTLGAGAFFAFVESLACYRPHLAELLRQEPTEGEPSAKRPALEDSSDDDDSDADLDRGPFPPSRPKDELVSSLQQELRRSCINLGERKAAIVEFSQRKEGVGPGLDDVCVTLSSLNFDDVVQAERDSERGERLRSGDGTTEARSRRRELASKTFASRCGDELELIDVGQLFVGPGGKRVKSLLVVGPAGTGKSLLLERIMECWAGGKVEVLSKFEFVVYVSARDATALQSGSVVGMLVTALERQIELSDTKRQTLEIYLQTNSRRVLVLVDSADEGGEAWERSKALENLFERRGLGSCTFVVTSRPCPRAYDLVLSCKRRYYLIGLNDRRLDELLVRRLGEEEGVRVAAQLKESSRQHVRELMKGKPLVANMMAKLASAGRAKSLPTSTTQIYLAMALDIIHHERAKEDTKFAEGQIISSFDDLPSEVQKMVEQLGKLAVDCLRQRRFVFDMKTLMEACGEEAISLGFLDKFVTRATGGSIGSAQEAEFRHLTWLEFFAAHCLTRKSESPCAAIRSCAEVVGVDEETEPFWKFVCGLVNPMHLEEVLVCLQTVFSQQHRSELEKRQWEWLAVRCIAEAAQQPTTNASLRREASQPSTNSASLFRDAIQPSTNSTSLLREAIQTATSSASLRRDAIQTATSSASLRREASQPSISSTSLRGEASQQSTSTSLSVDTHLHVEKASASVLPDCIDMTNSKPSVADTLVLSIALHHSPHVQMLNMKNCMVSTDHCTALGKGLTHVKKLDMFGNTGLHGGGLQALTNSLTQCSAVQLEILNIQNYTLDEDDCDAIGQLLHRVPSLRKLRLGSNYLGPRGISGLQESSTKSKLAVLDLQENDLNSEAGTSLGMVVRNSQHLQILGVTDNILGNDGVRELLSGVPCSSGLQFLDLSRTGVDDGVLDAVSTCLSLRSTTLQTAPGLLAQRLVIHLHSNNISRGGLEEVARRFPAGCQDCVECDSVEVKGGAVVDQDYEKFFKDYVRQGGEGDLGMDQRGIGDSGAEQIARLLQNDRNVHALHLGWNSIGDVGAAALGAALQVNTTLRGLSLGLNRVGCAGVVSMVTSLMTSHKTLKFIYLGRNPVFSDLMNADMRRSAREAVQRLVGASTGLRFLDLTKTRSRPSSSGRDVRIAS